MFLIRQFISLFRFKNQSTGFSTMEVMIGLSVAAIGVVGLNKFLNDSAKTTKSLSQGMEAGMMVGFVDKYFNIRKTDICTEIGLLSDDKGNKLRLPEDDVLCEYGALTPSQDGIKGECKERTNSFVAKTCSSENPESDICKSPYPFRTKVTFGKLAEIRPDVAKANWRMLPDKVRKLTSDPNVPPVYMVSLTVSSPKVTGGETPPLDLAFIVTLRGKNFDASKGENSRDITSCNYTSGLSGNTTVGINVDNSVHNEGSDGEASCVAMGGTWLSNKTNDRFFPRPRCHFGGVIDLPSTEWPDAIPDDGSSNGFMRPLECRYNYAGRYYEFKCPSRAPNSRTAGWVCRFDHSDNDGGGVWKRSWYQRTLVADGKSRPVYYAPDSMYWNMPCSGGVSVGKRSEALDILPFFEELSVAFPEDNEAPQTEGNAVFDVDKYVMESDKIHTVMRCKTDWNIDNWVNCINPTNPNVARAGGVGSCLYFRNGVVTSVTGLGELGQDKGRNRTRDYTGWAVVTTARSFSTKKDPVTKRLIPTITEAVGKPCFEVEVNSRAYFGRENSVYANIEQNAGRTAASETISIEQFNRVTQCVVAADPTVAVPGVSKRYTTLSCDRNQALEGEPNSWTEILRDADRLPDALNALQISNDPDENGEKGANEFGTLEELRTWPGTVYNATTMNNPVRVIIEGYKCQFTKGRNDTYLNPKLSFPNILCIDPSVGGDFVENATNRDFTNNQVVPDITPRDVVGLYNYVLAQYNVENKADAEALTKDTCGYFDNVKVRNWAVAEKSDPAVKDATVNVTYYNKTVKQVFPTSPSGFWTSGLSHDVSASDVKKAYSGWLWLSSLPAQKFRSEDGTILGSFANKLLTLTPSGTTSNYKFRQVELNTAGSIVPPLPTKNVEAGEVYRKLGTYGSQRPIVEVVGIPCTRGVRFLK